MATDTADDQERIQRLADENAARKAAKAEADALVVQLEGKVARQKAHVAAVEKSLADARKARKELR